ncbi:unnamed protein product [Aureobasidium uvarum]|uniref:Uncharacterized protein n=1 Tax=Aureobasidium uvarum TaxID=2773716 RepID=A0A9N8PT90_9PEZI|nr:unnamed protein product [Aureobasidium uvarum]
MGANKVIDDVQGSVMDIALGSLRARNTPMLMVEGLYWILDANLRPAIIAGYGTNDPEKMSSIHHIIKFHVRQVPIFNVVSAMEDYAVKHTRVATVNVVIYDEKIPASDIVAARGYLTGQYMSYVLDVAAAFRNRGFEVPTVAQFETEPATKGKTKSTSKTKVTKAKKAKPAKLNKRVRFIVEEDEEDGPIRCLTPIRKQPASVELPERSDSPMGDTPSPNFAYTANGLTLVVDADTPIKSVEYCPELSTPISLNETPSAPDGTWSFATCTAQNALFQPC